MKLDNRQKAFYESYIILGISIYTGTRTNADTIHFYIFLIIIRKINAICEHTLFSLTKFLDKNIVVGI